MITSRACSAPRRSERPGDGHFELSGRHAPVRILRLHRGRFEGEPSGQSLVPLRVFLYGDTAAAVAERIQPTWQGCPSGRCQLLLESEK